MTRDELKAIVRTAPTVEATYAEVDAEYQQTASHLAALSQRREELSGKLTKIATAKAELESTGEPTPAHSSAAKPKNKGK